MSVTRSAAGITLQRYLRAVYKCFIVIVRHTFVCIWIIVELQVGHRGDVPHTAMYVHVVHVYRSVADTGTSADVYMLVNQVAMQICLLIFWLT